MKSIIHKNYSILCKLTALVLMIPVIYSLYFITLHPKVNLTTLIVMIPMLNVFPAIAIYLKRKIGFYLAYIMVVITTVFFSISYIPIKFIYSAFIDKSLLFIPMTIINTLLIIWLVYLHLFFGKK